MQTSPSPLTIGDLLITEELAGRSRPRHRTTASTLQALSRDRDIGKNPAAALPRLVSAAQDLWTADKEPPSPFICRDPLIGRSTTARIANASHRPLRLTIASKGARNINKRGLGRNSQDVVVHRRRGRSSAVARGFARPQNMPGLAFDRCQQGLRCRLEG
jgi:hypothetical protein